MGRYYETPDRLDLQTRNKRGFPLVVKVRVSPTVYVHVDLRRSRTVVHSHGFFRVTVLVHYGVSSRKTRVRLVR